MSSKSIILPENMSDDDLATITRIIDDNIKKKNVTETDDVVVEKSFDPFQNDMVYVDDSFILGLFACIENMRYEVMGNIIMLTSSCESENDNHYDILIDHIEKNGRIEKTERTSITQADLVSMGAEPSTVSYEYTYFFMDKKIDIKKGISVYNDVSYYTVDVVIL